jgi:hypothetical protein
LVLVKKANAMQAVDKKLLKHPADIVGKTDYDLAWKKEESEFFRECDERVMSTGKAEYHIIEPQRQADGKNAWLDTNKIGT